MIDNTKLTALVASRICHDLISPIGAIGNGVELLTMESGGTLRPEFALISESVANANARIRLFRIAFGAASVTPTPISARFAPAGLVSGPRRLNAVRTPISRLGAVSCRPTPMADTMGSTIPCVRAGRSRRRSAGPMRFSAWSLCGSATLIKPMRLRIVSRCSERSAS